MLHTPEESLHHISTSDTDIISLNSRFYRVPRFNTETPKTIVSGVSEVSSFFEGLVAEAARVINVPVKYFEKDWIVQLMARFHHRQEFFDVEEPEDGIDEADKVHYKCLTEMACGALQTRDFVEEATRLLKTGDQALFSAGFFPERIKKKLGPSGLDYYEGMSRTSYSQAADMMKVDYIKKAAKQVGNFRKLVRCICTALRNDQQGYGELMMECGQAERVRLN